MTVSTVGVDTEKRSIEVIPNVVIGLTNPGSRRWKAFNLLEEIDIPGEFYIDRDEMILYLYPPHTLKDAKVEMDIEYSSLISVVEASNITFRDITFTQSRGDAVSMKNVRNIDFLGCQFRDIGQYGIRATGTEIPVTGASYWQIGYVKNNASYDVDIKDCTFDNLGGVGIYLLGGNVDELIPSGNVVENNIFSRTNQRYFFNGCMFISGCGNTVRQNDISHIPFHAITFSGNDHLIELNEIYDAVRESGDAGAIYQGRNQLYRGTSILKNYFHGIVNGDPLLFSHTRCIYMDDAQHGNIIENNIMVGGQEGYNCNGGAAMEFSYNIIADNETAWRFSNQRGYETPIVTTSTYGADNIADLVADIKNKDLFFEHYPKLKEWVETGKNPRLQTNYRGNVLVNNGKEEIYSQEEMFVDFSSTIRTDDKGIFVDPENHDWRIRSDSWVAEQQPKLLNDKNFDIGEIGVQRKVEYNSETAPFRLLYPHNNSKVQRSGVQLCWQEAEGANEYRVLVAKDRDFKEIVVDKISRNYTYNLDILDANQDYYWKVIAIKTSKNLGNEWQHDGAVYKFTTDLYDKVDTTSFEYAIALAEDNMYTITEGDKGGYYKFGTIEEFNSYIEKTRTLSRLRLGLYTQQALDARTEVISKFFTNKNLINWGYVDLVERTQGKLWRDNVIISDDQVFFSSGKENNAPSRTTGTQGLLNISGTVIYCFDMIIDAQGDSFSAVGVNKDNQGYAYKGNNNGYYMIFKDDMTELQKTDGKSNSVVAESKKVFRDGKKHSVEYAVINTSVGCRVRLIIDGEEIFDYCDVSNTANTNVNMEFTMSSSAEGETITILKPESIPSGEEFEKFLKNAEYLCAEAAVKTFPEASGVKVIKAGVNKVLTNDAIFTLGLTPEFSGDEMMVPITAAKYLLGATVSGNCAAINGTTITFAENSATVDVNGTKKQSKKPAFLKDGVLMVSIGDLLGAVGKSYDTDWGRGIVTVPDEGAVNTVNDGFILSRLSTVLDKIKTFGDIEDIHFKNID